MSHLCSRGGCFNFPIYCSIAKPERINGDLGRKRPNFALLTPSHEKFRGGIGEKFEWILRVRPRTKPVVHWPSGTLEIWCQKTEVKHTGLPTYVGRSNNNNGHWLCSRAVSCRDQFIVIIYRRVSRDLACWLRTSDQDPTVFECRLFNAS